MACGSRPGDLALYPNQATATPEGFHSAFLAECATGCGNASQAPAGAMGAARPNFISIAGDRGPGKSSLGRNPRSPQGGDGSRQFGLVSGARCGGNALDR